MRKSSAMNVRLLKKAGSQTMEAYNYFMNGSVNKFTSLPDNKPNKDVNSS